MRWSVLRTYVWQLYVRSSPTGATARSLAHFHIFISPRALWVTSGEYYTIAGWISLKAYARPVVGRALGPRPSDVLVSCSSSTAMICIYLAGAHSPSFTLCFRSPLYPHRMQISHLLQRGLPKGRLGRPQKDLQGPQRRQGSAAPPSRSPQRNRHACADDRGPFQHGRRLQGNLSSVPCHQAEC